MKEETYIVHYIAQDGVQRMKRLLACDKKEARDTVRRNHNVKQVLFATKFFKP